MSGKKSWAVFANGQVKDMGTARSVSPGAFPKEWGEHFIMESESRPQGVAKQKTTARRSGTGDTLLKSGQLASGIARGFNPVDAMKKQGHNLGANSERQGDSWNKKKQSDYKACTGPFDCAKTIGKGLYKGVT